MSMAVITIQTEHNASPFNNIIYTNSIIINKLNLPLYTPINLSFGSKQIKVILRPSPFKSKLLLIPANIANYLHLPNGIQTHLKYYKNNKNLKLGPILGILIQSIQDSQKNTPFGKLTPFAFEVSYKARTKGVLPYFFTVNDINRETGSVTGWMLKDLRWEKRIFSIPDVIYNRIASRRIEEKVLPMITDLKEKYGFVFFNDYFLNKWDVFQMLKPTVIEKILPKTVIYRSSRTIKEMLNTFPVIFLKPTSGSLGRGIIRVHKQQNFYTISYSRSLGSVSLAFNSFPKAIKYLLPRIQKKPYLVQQGLDLITMDNRPVDFRILVQKSAKGKWAVTSMIARIANYQHFISNLAQGGTKSAVFETIKTANPEMAKKIIKKQFKFIALTTAKYIESETKGNFAELGIDLALDKNGKIWLLEVNSKPSKIDEQRESTEPRPSVTRLIDYILYINDFQKGGKHG